jgi:hypothetical protein
LTFNREVLAGKMFFPVISKTFVERDILVLGDIIRFANPNRRSLVEGF